MAWRLPGSVLFACSMNAIRSPMAEVMLKHLHGGRIYVDSAGVHRGETDGFAIAVMDEIGLDLTRHYPKCFDDLDDDYFDVIISLSPEAQHRAVEMTRYNDCALEFWHMPDPSLAEGTREQRLEAYRELRDQLMERIVERFPKVAAPRLG